jgi:hypothetical protein
MHTCPVRNDRIEINPVADGYVVYDLDLDRVHYLNHTAAFVLELCTGQRTVADITETLKGAYEPGSPDEPIGELVGGCIEQLCSLGLVRRNDAAESVIEVSSESSGQVRQPSLNYD